VVAHADDITRNFELIRDYQRRPLQAKRLERVVEEANFFFVRSSKGTRVLVCRRDALAYLRLLFRITIGQNAVWEFDTRSALLAPTLAVVFAGMLVLGAPYLVLNSHFSLGEVLVSIQVRASPCHLHAPSPRTPAPPLTCTDVSGVHA
jgi:hypothetical protein